MLLSSLIIGGGPIQKRFTNFHAKGKKVVIENHLYFVLKYFKTRILKETGERSLKLNKQQMTSTAT